MKRRGFLFVITIASPSLLFAGDGSSSMSPLPLVLGSFLLLALVIICLLYRKVMGLQKKNKEQRYFLAQRMKIARSMSNIYHTAFYVSVIRDTFLDFSVKGNDEELIDTPGSARKMLQNYALDHSGPKHLRELKQFFDIDALSGKVNPSNLYTMNYKDINNRWNQTNLIVGDRDEKGNICHIFIGIRDIDEETKRHEAEEYQMDEELSLIEGLSTDYREVWLLKTKDMSINLYRSQYASVINRVLSKGGYSTSYDEGKEKLVRYFVYGADKAEVLDALRYENIEEKTKDGSTYYISFRQILDGTMHYRQLVVSRADTKFGDKNLVFAIRDVSEIVLKEKAQQETLEKALAEAERANRAKTAFLNSMSHDMRTPMNAIIGFAELASDQPQDSRKTADYLQKIQTSSQHLLSLINDVLDMSRIESGKISISQKPADLELLLRDVRTIIEPDMVTRNLVFVSNISLVHKFILCDDLRLKQVLINILSNAMKFTHSGGTITATLAEEPLSEEKSLYTFRIEDTGIGISEEFLPRIFLPFEREASTTVSGIQGTGLGLAITKELVDRMDGTITAESKKGEGSAFTICLPLLYAKEEPLQKKPAASTGTMKFEGKRILYVEDNLLNQEIGQITLENAGFLVDIASDGAIALEKVKTSEDGFYSAVLMDIQMPNMDGYEATRRIRSLETKALSSIPIIALSANVFDDAKDKAKEVGMSGHLSKPINVPDLLATLETILQ